MLGFGCVKDSVLCGWYWEQEPQQKKHGGIPLLLHGEGAHLHRPCLHPSELARIFGVPTGHLGCSGSSSPCSGWCESH